jgi:acyl-CoA reductase-like NAD-dependent aldehyde dehydrogenase
MVATIEVRSPADGRVVGSLPKLGAAEVTRLAASLRDAQPAWEDLGPEGRARVLLRWADWLLDNERRLAELVQRESGKAWSDAVVETSVSVEVINYYARHAAEFLAPRKVRPHGPAGVTKKLTLRFRPHQLVGVITPWNGPLGAPIMDIAPALMAGAAVLSKPSEVAPLSWAEAVRGWREDVGAPPVLAAATGDGSTGAAVVDEVDMVMFTGSTRTGRAIATRAAERLIPCSLELGGKDAMVVLADADLERAASAAAWGGMLNGGQLCISVERVYVEAPVYEDFVARLTAKVAALRQGTDRPGAFACEVGAMATAAQLEIVERHVRDAVEKGATVTTGGRRSASGLYFEPTVLRDVDHTMACMQEETFGPTVPVMRAGDEAEAVRLANDSPYGLSASVWSRDAARAQRVAGQLEAGAVNVNNVLMNLFQFTLPQGGWKQSGLGTRLGGAGGLLKYCRPQAIVEERVALKSEPFWFPVSPRKNELIARVSRLLAANDWRRKLGLTPKHEEEGRGLPR